MLVRVSSSVMKKSKIFANLYIPKDLGSRTYR